MEDAAVFNFCSYIRCKTVHPNPDYRSAVEFLTKMAKEIGLKIEVFEFVPDNPVCLMTLEGTDPSLPSLLLNSHTDVVPVFPEHWKCDPFAAIIDEKGKIYGRGTQDMKCVGIQYLEALRILKSRRNFVPKRTIHLSFVPDEEVGGHKGMVAFLESEVFKKLNVGFALDEGLASTTSHFKVYYGERSIFSVDIKARGNPGHGSQFIENTAYKKLHRMINKFIEFRESEKRRLEETDSGLALGDVTTLNLTMIHGGVQTNVVPAEIAVKFDARISPHLDPNEFAKMVTSWASESGLDQDMVSINNFGPHKPLTPVDDSNPWWVAFKGACDSMGLKLDCEIFPAATDSRYLRKIKIPALGFSPMNNTPILLHDNNEYLDRDVFLRGIDIYVNIIEALTEVRVET